MSTQVKWRGGTTAEHAVFTGALREVTVDTDKHTLVVHDGQTPGGFPLMRADGVPFGTTNPAMDGTASPGNSPQAARHNHVHPSDTALEARANSHADTAAANAQNNAINTASSNAATYANQAYANANAYTNAQVSTLLNTARPLDGVSVGSYFFAAMTMIDGSGTGPVNTGLPGTWILRGFSGQLDPSGSVWNGVGLAQRVS